MNNIQSGEESILVSYKEDEYYDFSCNFVPSSYVLANDESGWVFVDAQEEAADKEIIHCLERNGYFDFLDDSYEDIYRLGDGKAI